MADLIRLTEDWVNVTASGDQPLYAAIDVLQYDILDLLMVTSMESSGSPSLTMSLLSGNQVQSTGSWITLANAFQTVTSTMTGAGTIRQLTLTGGFFRYLRWSVSLSNVTAARFYIEVVGRRYC